MTTMATHVLFASSARAVIQAQEDECRGLARELHDDLGQKLAVLEVEIESLERGVPLNKEAASRLAGVRRRVAAISEDVYRICHQLHPSILDDLGLVAAARSCCDEFRRWSGIRIRFAHSGVPSELPAQVARCVYRVVQEALRNAGKHSGARQAFVNLRGTGSMLQLLIRDNGHGFEPEHVHAGGLGLVSMSERVRLAGGEYSIESAPGRGTRIRVSIPMKRARAAAV